MNIVVVGLGSAGLRHLKLLKKINSKIVTHAVSSSGNIRGRKRKSINFLHKDFKFLDKINVDKAIIASPATFHEEHAAYFSKLEIPVLIEKPLTADITSAERLNKIYSYKPQLIKIAYCLRFLTSAQKIKRIIDSKEMGEVYNVIVNVGQFLPDWRQKSFTKSVSAQKSLGGGVLLELSHELDYLQWFFGELVCKFAVNRNSKELNLNVEELSDIFFRTKEGAVIFVHLDFIQKRLKRECTIICEKGNLFWNLVENNIYLNTKDETRIIYKESGNNQANMYENMLQAFISNNKNSSLFTNIKESISIISLVEKIKKFNN